ncbi:hypothetical protein AVEN_127137-1 [Araneus ventricosus]|uniref:DDE-1 domain-containing protein n=1 Tax=Araneus ventricosus TaxID=182803 RepID=A0A4Y2NBQ6_ARAVE|nr:hypothetical protein AVEN_193365-1 [Araneus ventricosus]GBN36070.1 hypothetical protein AVEN_127137-1 [Araneus ventricosus]
MSHDETMKGGLTPREFQKYHFHIISCLKMIENTWEEVTKKTLTSAWKNLWQESIVECIFRGLRQCLWSLQSAILCLLLRSWDWMRKMISMCLRKTKARSSPPKKLWKHQLHTPAPNRPKGGFTSLIGETPQNLRSCIIFSQQEVVEESLSKEGDNSKATIFWRNKRNSESMGENCRIVH